MHRLLSQFESELAFLHDTANEFARRYPRIAGRLLTGNQVLQDPHVERLAQAFAVLSARMHKRLDDDFPLFTQTLLGLFYPHYLRPFPSCSIVRFDLDQAAQCMHTSKAIPRGAVLDARSIHNVTCRFTTTATAQLLPLQVVDAGLRAGVNAPYSPTLSDHDTARLSIRFELAPSVSCWRDLGIEHIRLFIDGEPALVTLLRETLVSKVTATLVQTSKSGSWHSSTLRPRPVGFHDSEVLIDVDARCHQAYQLLIDYFAFPEKFNFVDLLLPELAMHVDDRELCLHFILSGIRSDSNEARLLELVNASNFLTGCAPVINLFSWQASPIKINHRSTTYRVLPEHANIPDYEVYAIDRVLRAHETEMGTTVEAIPHIYSLLHEHLSSNGDQPPPYWYAFRSDMMSEMSPGCETEIGLTDMCFDASVNHADTLSIELRATNRGLPCQISIGKADGDLELIVQKGEIGWVDGNSQSDKTDLVFESIRPRLLRRPSLPRRINLHTEGLRRLMSLLSLSHLSLPKMGIDALKEVLRLYDFSDCTHAERLIDGLVSVEYRSVEGCAVGNPYAVLVRGTEIQLTVNEHYFVGRGLFLFAQVMEHFFGLYAHLNTFVRLQLLSFRAGQVLFDGAPRIGGAPLI